MPFGIQPIHLVIIAIVALLVFGPQKLPEIGRGVGKAFTEFRRGMRDMGEGFKDEVNQPVNPAAVQPQAPMLYQPVAPQPVIIPTPVQSVAKADVKYCTTCGSPNPAGAKFCNACGSPMMVSVPVEETSPAVPPAQEEPASPENPVEVNVASE